MSPGWEPTWQAGASESAGDAEDEVTAWQRPPPVGDAAPHPFLIGPSQTDGVPRQKSPAEPGHESAAGCWLAEDPPAGKYARVVLKAFQRRRKGSQNHGTRSSQPYEFFFKVPFTLQWGGIAGVVMFDPRTSCTPSIFSSTNLQQLLPIAEDYALVINCQSEAICLMILSRYPLID